MGMITGVKSLTDALAEEMGYDFNDWSDKMIMSYVVKGNDSSSSEDPLDQLAFLLDQVRLSSMFLICVD